MGYSVLLLSIMDIESCLAEIPEETILLDGDPKRSLVITSGFFPKPRGIIMIRCTSFMRDQTPSIIPHHHKPYLHLLQSWHNQQSHILVSS